MCSTSLLEFLIRKVGNLKTLCLVLLFLHLEKYLILNPVLHMLMNRIFVSCLALFQVKKIMNGVFQSLRGEFELEETYSGRTVLGVVMNTIKVRQW